MRLLMAAVATCLICDTALAEPNMTGPAQPAHAAANVAYDGYIAGLNAMKVKAAIDLRPDGYEFGVNFRTAGLVGTFSTGDMNSKVSACGAPGGRCRSVMTAPGCGAARRASRRSCIRTGNLR